uniref:Uncharacterized protein n=1 Tax=viral metagenome TaxID=1070528 RepID=A0A6C0C703_9ZZZZ
MNIILLIVLSFTLLIILQNIIENRNGVNDVLNKIKNTTIDNHFNSVKNNRNSVINNINNKSKQKVKYDDPFSKFPDPMLSTISNPLSPGYSPLNSDNNNLLSNDPNVKVIRDNGFDNYKNKQIYFDPFHVHKDTMDADPGNYTRQGLAKVWDGSETMINADSDEYLTKYPEFASADFTNQLTNMGYLYDNNENNKYINLKDKVLPDNCKLSNNNELECKFNNKLQKIPKELMKNDSNVLNSVGVINQSDDLIKSVKDFSYDEIGGNVYKSWKYENEKEINGNFVFGNIMPSNPFGSNESYMLVDDSLNCSTCSI